MKQLIIGLALVSLLLVGCGHQAAYSPPDVHSPPTDTSSIPAGQEPTALVDDDWEASHQNVNWISPGKVAITIVNAHLGTSANTTGCFIRIHNGGDYATTFVIEVTEPNAQQLPGGYEVLPPEYHDWVHIDNTAPYLLAKETREIWIGFDIPPRDELWYNKYEIQTRVMEAGQGQIATATATRWQLDLQ